MTDEPVARDALVEIAELRRSFADAQKNESKLWADVQALERLVRGAQTRVLELRAALCLVLLDLEGEWGHDPTLPEAATYSGPQSGRNARAILGLSTAEEIPESWYKMPC